MEKQRKFYLVLPLLVIPFLTMAFWALGGGKGSGDPIQNAKGLDTSLPQAQFQNESNDKLALYQAAQRDSMRNGISPAFLNAMGLSRPSGAPDSPANDPEQQAARLQQKLSELNRTISIPTSSSANPPYSTAEPPQLKKLNQLMQNTGKASEDPELKQLDRMLDKLQAIQNPGTAPAAPVAKEIDKPFRAIPATVSGKQKIANGAAVQLQLSDTVTIKGQLLPKGHLIFGSAQVTNQRLLVQVKNIRLGTQIIPADLTVFSEDGMPGIPAPEAALSSVTASNADQALQSMQLMNMEQSLGAQAAIGGINAAKDLFSKKVKKIKVKVADRYPVLLKINR